MKRNYYPGIGQLKIYVGGKTITLYCPRHEAKNYLKYYDWSCFDWNGKKHKHEFQILY